MGYEMELFKETSADIRHYSSLRFQILAAFLVFQGVLMTIAFRDVFRTPLFWLPMSAGIFISVLYAILEWRINRGLERLVRRSNALEDLLQMPKREPLTRIDELLRKWYVSIALWGLFAGAIAIWIGAEVLSARAS